MTQSMTLLLSLTNYCYKNPDQRFWQALRNWSDQNFILASNGETTQDTFNWEGRNGQLREDTKKGKPSS